MKHTINSQQSLQHVKGLYSAIKDYIRNWTESSDALLLKEAELVFVGDILEAGNWNGVTCLFIAAVLLITRATGLTPINSSKRLHLTVIYR